MLNSVFLLFLCILLLAHSMFANCTSSIYAGLPIFNVRNTGKVELVASDFINLKPGFYSQSGSYFHATIDPGITCTPGPLMRKSDTPLGCGGPRLTTDKGVTITYNGQNTRIDTAYMANSDSIKFNLLPSGNTCGYFKSIYIYLNSSLSFSNSNEIDAIEYKGHLPGTYKFNFQFDSNGSGTYANYLYTIVVITPGLNTLPDQELSDAINIYPNPSSGIYNFEIKTQKSEKINILVEDLLGKKVFEKNSINTSTQITEIDLSNLPQGIYFLTATDESGAKARRKLELSKK